MTAKADDESNELAALLARAMYSALLGGADGWAKLNLTMPQLKVVLLLGSYGSAPVSWLAARMGVSPPNVTGILDRLEQHGCVRRTNDPRDRRVVRVVLTEEGEQLLRDLQAPGQGGVLRVIAGMARADRAALHRGLAALLDAASVAHGPPEAGTRAASS